MFKKGQSGNPAGRPRGARNRKTILLQNMLDEDGEAILKKALSMAKDGDGLALRLCMDRLLPKRVHEPVQCDLPPIERPADAVTAMAEISGAVAAGGLAPAEAAAMAKVVTSFVQAFVAQGLDERLARVEAAQEAEAGTPKLPAPGAESIPVEDES